MVVGLSIFTEKPRLRVGSRVIVGDVVDYVDKLAEHPFIRLAPLGFSVVGFACHASTLRLSSMLFLTLAGSAFSALRRS